MKKDPKPKTGLACLIPADIGKIARRITAETDRAFKPPEIRSGELVRRRSLRGPQTGYWLEAQRIETPNDAHDKVLLIAVNAATGERHVVGAA